MSHPAARLAGAFQPLLAPLNRIFSRAGGPVLLGLLLMFAFWRILLTDQYTWLNSPDLAHQVMPWLQFQAGEWHAGRLPLWSPFEWGGQNLIGQAQPGVVNPLFWLLFVMPLKNGWLREGVLNWWFWLMHYIAGLNLYFLARSLGAGKLAGVAGGLLFALMGYLGFIDWPQMITGLIWAPLVLLYLFRTQNAPNPWRSATLAGLFLGLSWLSGHHQQPIFVHLAVAGLVLALRAWHGIYSVALGVVIGAVQLLPAVEYGKAARRWVGMENPVGWKDKVAYFVHEQFSDAPSSLLGILLPGLETHIGLYLGATGLLLALWAVQRRWARPEVRFLLALGIGALLYVMGRFGLIEPLLYALVPMVEKARSPAMAGGIFTLAFAVLAALGMDELSRAPGDSRAPRFHWIFGGAVFALYTLGLLLPRNQQHMEERWLSVAFVSLLVGWAYKAVRTGYLPQSRLPWLLLAAMLVESSNYTYFNMANRLDKNATSFVAPLSKHADVRNFLSTRPGPVRVTVDDKAIPYNFGDWHGVDVMGGYLASLSINTLEIDWFSARGLQLAGVAYHVGPTPRTPESKLLFSSPSGINVYEYAHTPNPRAFLVNRTMVYGKLEELSALLNQQSVDLRTTALLKEPVNGLGIASLGEHRFCGTIQTVFCCARQANCPSLLVLADTDEAGWSVTVDGAKAERLTVNHAQRGVLVPAGNHTIEWRYRPKGFLPGLMMTGLGLIFTGFVVLFVRR